MSEKKEIIPKGFFSSVKNVITSKEALKDVTPINWSKALKNRKENNKQIIKLIDKTNKTKIISK